jgi:hypothetical protein
VSIVKRLKSIFNFFFIMSAYNVQINYVAMVTSCHTIFFFHFQNVELQTMATVVLRVVPVIQLILPTVTTLTGGSIHRKFSMTGKKVTF